LGWRSPTANDQRNGCWLDSSFEWSDLKEKNMVIDSAYVKQRLESIVKDQDLSRYIL